MQAKHEGIKGGLKEVDNHRAVRLFSRTPGPSIFVDMSHKSEGGPGGCGSVVDPPPASSVSFSAVFRKKQSIDTVSTYTLSTPARGGGGLPLPAAAAAAPF